LILKKSAFLFPGQGSQYVGMGNDIYQKYAKVRERYEQANDILGFNIVELSFNGIQEKLNQTYITQPAIFVHSYILFEMLKDIDLLPAMTAGHSLGEYTALAAAGCLDFAEALSLVKLRGELMQNASDDQKGTMAAVIGLENDIVENICREISQKEIVGIANYNSPGQIVLSGSMDGVRLAMQLANDKGAKRVIELQVSGAFHSPLMGPALKTFNEELQKVAFNKPSIEFFSNVTAGAVTDPDELKLLLAKQLSSPVLWMQTIQQMNKAGATGYFEVGPGNVLTGLLRRIDRNYSVTTVNSLKQFLKFKENN